MVNIMYIVRKKFYGKNDILAVGQWNHKQYQKVIKNVQLFLKFDHLPKILECDIHKCYGSSIRFLYNDLF